MNTITVSTLAPSMAGYRDLASKYAHLLDLVQRAAGDGADLVCLPELSNSLTGLLPEPSERRSLDALLDAGPLSIQDFINAAKQHRLAIVLPVLLKDGDSLYNSALFIDETGAIRGRYDKVYPTIGEIEEGVRPGAGPVTVHWRGIDIGFMICFDANYGDLAEAYRDKGAKLVVFPTMFDGGALINSFAFLYGMYFVTSYSEWSRFVDLFGRDSAAMGRRMESWRSDFIPPVLTRTINFDFMRFHLAFNQNKFAGIQSKYGKQIQIHVDQGSALAVLESWSKDVTSADIAAEFELEPMDAYLARAADRARAARQ